MLSKKATAAFAVSVKAPTLEMSERDSLGISAKRKMKPLIAAQAGAK